MTGDELRLARRVARALALPLAFVAAGLVLAGCSGDDAEPVETATATQTAIASASSPASATVRPSQTATTTPDATSTTSTTATTATVSATTAATATQPPSNPTPTPTPAPPTSTPTPLPTNTPVPDDGTFVVNVSQGGVSANVRVEIAATAGERQLGLMYRTEMAEDAGMLFLFPRTGTGGFWMRNTLIPLDIAYIGADLKVVDIKHGVPLDETALTPSAPYLYVLEVNGGWFERHGMGPGAVVTLPGGLPTPTDR